MSKLCNLPRINGNWQDINYSKVHIFGRNCCFHSLTLSLFKNALFATGKVVCVLSNPLSLSPAFFIAEHHEDPHRDHSHVPAVPHWEGMSEMAEIAYCGSQVVSAFRK